ncbi:hypothetical protein [Burkholderia sp. Bp9143]|uniref:hypothetical protein n=1 Tax=Burkholderia sp. Bp9143 TaxID=2184574 RepID=UPI000F5A11CB|nr:hypothetical protein [Burkholderia sp. Bp9143]
MLAYQFFALREVTLTDLRFPFTARWYSERGVVKLSKRYGSELVRRDGFAHVRREELFDVAMSPDQTGAVAGQLQLDLPAQGGNSEPDWCALAAAYENGKGGLGFVLAQNMFLLPEYPWTISALASRLAIKPRMLQMSLFQECYSFDAVLRRCRRLNALLQLGGAGCVFEIVAGPVCAPDNIVARH